MSKKRYEGVPCPQDGCETVFSGTNLQIINNFRTHYRGTHIKGDEDLLFDENNIREKIIKRMPKEYSSKDKSSEVLEIIEEAFSEIHKYNEPETSVEDESVIGQKVNDGVDGSKYDLVNYLSFPPICKEERQFALYFANKLYIEDAEIIKSLIDQAVLSKDETIKEVFFEVAIMRDYWNSNKQLFNAALLDYVTSSPSELPIDIKLNAGHQKNDYIDKMGEGFELHANSWTPPNAIARWMMNAKPDIGLITEKQGKYSLSFIECKYTSNEVPYKHEEVTRSLKQTELQEIILDFIVNKIEAKYKNYPLEKGQVKLVRFVNRNKPFENEIVISIRELSN